MKKKLPDDCMPKCESCAFVEMDQKEGVGLCHRFPPIFAADDEGSGFTFPGVSPIDWCGEYKRRTN